MVRVQGAGKFMSGGQSPGGGVQGAGKFMSGGQSPGGG